MNEHFDQIFRPARVSRAARAWVALLSLVTAATLLGGALGRVKMHADDAAMPVAAFSAQPERPLPAPRPEQQASLR